MSQTRGLSLSARGVPGGRTTGALGNAATAGVGEAALRAGLTLLVVVAATNCVFALVAGAGVLAAGQGIVLVAAGLAGVVRVDVAARVLLPKGRVVLLVGLFSVGGALDAGLYEHFGAVAGALVCIAAFVCAARWVALCVVVCVVGYLGALARHGSSLAWMVGDGRYIIAGHLVNFAGNGAVGLLMVALLRRFLAGAPQRLAAVRAGGRSLTAQLALAASGRHVAVLPAADPRTLIARLTHGERQVVALLAAGRVPKQAANDLSIALATVRSRLASAKRKTGARTLDQLVAMYSEAERAA
jgi:DNA-binding CsgD family transcriptional regulator